MTPVQSHDRFKGKPVQATAKLREVLSDMGHIPCSACQVLTQSTELASEHTCQVVIAQIQGD